MNVKYCLGHREFLPVEKFGVDRSREDGLKLRCKECTAKYTKFFQRALRAGAITARDDHLGAKMIGVDVFAQVFWDSGLSIGQLAIEHRMSRTNVRAIIYTHAVKMWLRSIGITPGDPVTAEVAASLAVATINKLLARELRPYVSRPLQWIRAVRCGKLHRRTEPADLPERWVEKSAQD